jgi:hypothetical protein
MRFPPIADTTACCHSERMLLPRMLTIAAVALLLLGLVYAGYVNELLKGAIAPWHRGVLVVGFIIGAGAVSRELTTVALKRRKRVGRDES